MSQTLSLKPSVWTDLILNPWVGVIVDISSLARVFKIVVFPALSRPRRRILSSLSGEDFNFLQIRNTSVIHLALAKRAIKVQSQFLTALLLIVRQLEFLYFISNDIMVIFKEPKMQSLSNFRSTTYNCRCISMAKEILSSV